MEREPRARGRSRSFGFRRFLLPLLMVSVFLNLALIERRSVSGPPRVTEAYVSGGVGPGLPKIAVIELSGTLNDAKFDAWREQIARASTDSDVEAVILRVDSPGGTVTASDRLWREVATRLKDRKPLIVSMGGTAASGGYYVAAAADAIFAEPTTMTGSIGVILEIPQLRGLLDKAGVDFATITTGPWKDSGSPYREMSDAERERFRQVIDRSYQRFVRVVAQGRSMDLERARELADGRVFTADEALEAGLIDEIGYLDDAVRFAMRVIRREDVRVVRYVRSKSLFEEAAGLIGIRAPGPGSGNGGAGVSLEFRADLETWDAINSPRLMMILR